VKHTTLHLLVSRLLALLTAVCDETEPVCKQWAVSPQPKTRRLKADG
jgi:hypothetical protein